MLTTDNHFENQCTRHSLSIHAIQEGEEERGGGRGGGRGEGRGGGEGEEGEG